MCPRAQLVNQTFSIKVACRGVLHTELYSILYNFEFDAFTLHATTAGRNNKLYLQKIFKQLAQNFSTQSEKFECIAKSLKTFFQSRYYLKIIFFRYFQVSD